MVEGWCIIEGRAGEGLLEGRRLLSERDGVSSPRICDLRKFFFKVSGFQGFPDL
jgi:hypothetical protein